MECNSSISQGRSCLQLCLASGKVTFRDFPLIHRPPGNCHGCFSKSYMSDNLLARVVAPPAATTGRSGAARGRTASPARRACWPSGRKKARPNSGACRWATAFPPSPSSAIGPSRSSAATRRRIRRGLKRGRRQDPLENPPGRSLEERLLRRRAPGNAHRRRRPGLCPQRQRGLALPRRGRRPCGLGLRPVGEVRRQAARVRLCGLAGGDRRYARRGRRRRQGQVAGGLRQGQRQGALDRPGRQDRLLHAARGHDRRREPDHRPHGRGPGERLAQGRQGILAAAVEDGTRRQRGHAGHLRQPPLHFHRLQHRAARCSSFRSRTASRRPRSCGPTRR